MMIKEVEISRIFDCKYSKLKFDFQCGPVYLVQNNEDPNCMHIFTIALQLVFSAEYAHLNLGSEKVFNKVRDGFVGIKFVLPLNDRDGRSDVFYMESSGSDDSESDARPTTSQAAAERRAARTKRRQSFYQQYMKIYVKRDFRRQPNEVCFAINDEHEECCSLPDFHSRFHLCLDYVMPLLETDLRTATFNGDWISLLSLDLNGRWNSGAEMADPFTRFVELYSMHGYPEDHLLSQLTRAQIKSNDLKEVLHKTFFVKCLRDVRGIFEYITNKEYSVLYFIPHMTCHETPDVEVTDLDFDHLSTYIQDNSKQTAKRYPWTDAAAAVKDMLLISFQVSLAFHCKQKLMYLRNFKAIADYQLLQLATASYLQILGAYKDAWITKNYLQRIVDICIASGTTAFIEYPGGIPLRPANVHFIKSYNIIKNGQRFLCLENVNNAEYDFESFMDGFKEFAIAQFHNEQNQN